MTDWKAIERKLAQAPDKFLKAAERQLNMRSDYAKAIKSPEYQFHQMPYRAEYPYSHKQGVGPFPSWAPAVVRIVGERAIVRLVGIHSWGKDAGQPTGRIEYKRHRICTFSLDGIAEYPSGYAFRTEAGLRHFLKKGLMDDFGFGFREHHTVDECRSQLQKHHPDKGGDAEKFHLWMKRFERAKRVGA